jgi:hypothetical protein
MMMKDITITSPLDQFIYFSPFTLLSKESQAAVAVAYKDTKIYIEKTRFCICAIKLIGESKEFSFSSQPAGTSHKDLSLL